MRVVVGANGRCLCRVDVHVAMSRALHNVPCIYCLTVIVIVTIIYVDVHVFIHIHIHVAIIYLLHIHIHVAPVDSMIVGVGGVAGRVVDGIIVLI